MPNFFLIKHHPRGLTEAYQENSCRTPAPRHTLPAFAGRHDDENLISLTRPSVNNPNPIMQSERVVLGEQVIVSKKGRFLHALPKQMHQEAGRLTGSPRLPGKGCSEESSGPGL